MKSFTPTPRYDCSEEAQASRIHKALAGQLHTENQEQQEKQIIKSLRRESVESIKFI